MTDTDTIAPATPPSRRRPFLWGCATGAALTLVAMIALLLASTVLFKDWTVAQKRKKLEAPPITTGQPGDFSLTFDALEGPPVALESLRGKPILLHFWSPSCVNCLPELESLEALYESTKADGIQFLAVAVAGFDDLADAGQKNGLTFPLYHYKSALPPLYQGGVPVTVILGADGQVAFKHMGSAKWDDPSVVTFLKTLAAASGR
mgnify:CR=1 FL=1